MIYQNFKIFLSFFHFLKSYAIAEIFYFKTEEIIGPSKLPFNDIFLKHWIMLYFP